MLHLVHLGADRPGAALGAGQVPEALVSQARGSGVACQCVHLLLGGEHASPIQGAIESREALGHPPDVP
eukprot:10500955-Lingulodinium_polyedra.AAC.1